MRLEHDNQAMYAALGHAAARRIPAERLAHATTAAIGDRDLLAWTDLLHRQTATVHVAILGDDPMVVRDEAQRLAARALALADWIEEQHGA